MSVSRPLVTCALLTVRGGTNYQLERLVSEVSGFVRGLTVRDLIASVLELTTTVDSFDKS